jgi:hypothetical protein
MSITNLRIYLSCRSLPIFRGTSLHPSPLLHLPWEHRHSLKQSERAHFINPAPAKSVQTISHTLYHIPNQSMLFERRPRFVFHSLAQSFYRMISLGCIWNTLSSSGTSSSIKFLTTFKILVRVHGVVMSFRKFASSNLTPLCPCNLMTSIFNSVSLSVKSLSRSVLTTRLTMSCRT